VTPMISIACRVEAGVRGPANDDRAAINHVLIREGSCKQESGSPCLLIVCDGVGGEAHGDEAAEIAADYFSRLSGMEMSRARVEEHVTKANEAIITAQRRDHRRARMATTIAGLYLSRDDYIAFNAGDTRVYRFREPYLSRISTDHSVRQEQIDLGVEPKRGQENMITRYLGGGFAVPEIVEGNGIVHAGDMFVLCTDGVWGALENEDFEHILANHDELDIMCGELVDLALKKGSTDNLSIIIARRD